MRRSAEGIYLNASNKYLTDYAVETAWREDTRRLSTGKKLRHLFLKAMSVGLSMWWRGLPQPSNHCRESPCSACVSRLSATAPAADSTGTTWLGFIEAGRSSSPYDRTSRSTHSAKRGAGKTVVRIYDASGLT